MLKGIHPLLTADLLHALAGMGHGDEIVLCDANFPATRLGRRVIELSGAAAVVRTGELRRHGNILLVKGVLNHYDPPA